MAVQVLAALTRIGECLMEVSPTYGEAWNGRMRCTTGTDQADQEHTDWSDTAPGTSGGCGRASTDTAGIGQR
jgi:hypothetical protein